VHVLLVLHRYEVSKALVRVVLLDTMVVGLAVWMHPLHFILIIINSVLHFLIKLNRLLLKRAYLRNLLNLGLFNPALCSFLILNLLNQVKISRIVFVVFTYLFHHLVL